MLGYPVRQFLTGHGRQREAWRGEGTIRGVVMQLLQNLSLRPHINEVQAGLIIVGTDCLLHLFQGLERQGVARIDPHVLSSSFVAPGERERGHGEDVVLRPSVPRDRELQRRQNRMGSDDEFLWRRDDFRGRESGRGRESRDHRFQAGSGRTTRGWKYRKASWRPKKGGSGPSDGPTGARDPWTGMPYASSKEGRTRLGL